MVTIRCKWVFSWTGDTLPICFAAEDFKTSFCYEKLSEILLSKCLFLLLAPRFHIHGTPAATSTAMRSTSCKLSSSRCQDGSSLWFLKNSLSWGGWWKGQQSPAMVQHRVVGGFSQVSCTTARCSHSQMSHKHPHTSPFMQKPPVALNDLICWSTKNKSACRDVVVRSFPAIIWGFSVPSSTAWDFSCGLSRASMGAAMAAHSNWYRALWVPRNRGVLW